MAKDEVKTQEPQAAKAAAAPVSASVEAPPAAVAIGPADVAAAKKLLDDFAAQEARKGDKPGRFKVSAPGHDEKVVDARDKNEAWAKYCDGIKVWPSPKVRTIERV